MENVTPNQQQVSAEILANLSEEELAAVTKFLQVQKKKKERVLDNGLWRDSVDEWLETLSEKTRWKYSPIIAKFEEHVNGFRDEEGMKPIERVGDVRTSDVEKYKAWILEYSESNNTRRSYHYAVRSFFTWRCEKVQLLRQIDNVFHPFEGVKRPTGKRRVKKRHDVLTKREVYALLDGAIHERARRHMALMYFFALRNFEAASVRGENLILETDEEGKEYIRLTGLWCKWNKEIGKEIKDRKCYQARALEILSPCAGMEGYVFPRKGGDRHRSRRTTFDWTKKSARAAKIRTYDHEEDGKCNSYVSTHWLRHACASAWYHARVDLKSISAYLGHGSVKMTLRYIHADPDASRKIEY